MPAIILTVIALAAAFLVLWLRRRKRKLRASPWDSHDVDPHPQPPPDDTHPDYNQGPEAHGGWVIPIFSTEWIAPAKKVWNWITRQW